MKYHNTQIGTSLIEIIIMIALLALLIPAISTAFITSREGRVQQQNKLTATSLMKETQEALRIIREANWGNISTNGIYHPVQTATSWSLASSGDTVNNISRTVTISDVYRDSSNTIVSSGGTVDPSTKKIDINLNWSSPLPSSISSTLYFTRYLGNLTYTQTTVTDFNSGTLTGTVVTNTAGGEVILGSGGSGDWCDPNLEIPALDLPKSGVANALTAIEGRAFAGTGENASGVSFANVSISNTNPPVATLQNTFDGYKTNGVFGETGYAYLTTDSSSKEVVIINTTSNTESGYFNAPGSTNGNAVYVVGTKGYMTQGSNFRIFDLTSKNGSRSQLGAVSLSGTGNSLVVSGNYAYVAIGSESVKLQIVDISNSSNPTIVGSANPSSGVGQDVVINSTATRAYLATASSSTQPELFIIDISTKTGTRPIIGSYDANEMDPKGLAVATGNKIILVGLGGEEYQTVDITNEATPSRCGGLNHDVGIRDVATVIEQDGDVFSYILTGDVSAEFRMIRGGPGGSFSSSGTYESAFFDIGYSGALNKLIPTVTLPTNTSIQFQLAIVDPVSGSCSGASYIYAGPDGTSSTYYTTTASIFLNDDNIGYENPARCFRYKAFLSSTDSSSSPILEQVKINYSP